jgi:cell division protein FtsL
MQRARARKIYIESSGDRLFTNIRPVLFLGFIVAFVPVISFLLVSAHNRAMQDLIETLSLERDLRQTHQKLKSEMAGITRSRMLALKAKERLGLSQPKDEEVLVLK